jgi:hypothetical protein
MAYAIRKMQEIQVAPGVKEGYVEEQDVVYCETYAEAYAAAEARGWPKGTITVTQIDDTMPDTQAAAARELYPGQTADEGAVADIPDEMYGAGQGKVYG